MLTSLHFIKCLKQAGRRSSWICYNRKNIIIIYNVPKLLKLLVLLGLGRLLCCCYLVSWVASLVGRLALGLLQGYHYYLTLLA